MKEMGKGCKPCATSALCQYFSMRLTPSFYLGFYLEAMHNLGTLQGLRLWADALLLSRILPVSHAQPRHSSRASVVGCRTPSLTSLTCKPCTTSALKMPRLWAVALLLSRILPVSHAQPRH